MDAPFRSRDLRRGGWRARGFVALRTALSVLAAAACASAMGGALLVASGGGPAMGQMLPGRPMPAPPAISPM